jgi:hypothetical protein
VGKASVKFISPEEIAGLHIEKNRIGYMYYKALERSKKWLPWHRPSDGLIKIKRGN